MIPCASPRANVEKQQDAILDAVTRVLDAGNYILGREVSAFEQEFAAYCGAAHAVGVASGTDALILTLRALGVGPGDEIVTVSHTALATIAAVIATGATPVLVDVDRRDWTIDPERVRMAITPRTKAIVPVHLYGQPADMDAMLAVGRERGIPIIEDCAQAAGATYDGRHVGSLGVAGCFSFYPTKNLGAIGDGGAVVTSDAALAARVRRLRQYGWDSERATAEPGVNSRLDEMQAAILRVKLSALDADNAARRAIATRYQRELDGLPLGRPSERPRAMHVYHLYVVTSEEREPLRRALLEEGIAAAVHYPVPGHLHRGYDDRCRVPAGGLPVTERLARTVLSLPMYPELTAEQAGLVTAAMKRQFIHER